MGLDLEINGLEELQNQLDELQSSAEDVDGENEVELGELLTDDFMRRNTDFESLEEFMENSQWEVESEEDFEAIPEEAFDDYVDEHTRFPDWEEMLGEATEEWFADQLGL